MRHLSKIVLFLVLLFVLFSGKRPDAPAFVKGDFIDDYGIRYSISDSVWTQHPRVRFRILRWNTAANYIIARNDSGPDKGKYTRIDYMTFSGMEPWSWGFCLSEYKAETDSAAEAVQIADRQNPRKGCNGFPFSRMKRTD